MARTDRVDSGFGESLKKLIEAGSSSKRSSLICHHNQFRSLEQPDCKATTASHDLSQPKKSKLAADHILPKSARPTTSPRNNSRRNSAAQSSLRGSNPSSRRSSFVTPQPMIPYNRRPHVTHRSATIAYDRRRGEDPFLLHHRSTQLFQPSETSSKCRFTERVGSGNRLISPSLPDLSLGSSATTATEKAFSTSQVDETDPILQHQYENHVPATVIDWTLPSTRRQEYREIDKSCQGIRGLWRRMVPRRFRRDSRLIFFKDDDSDAGSVRRYRLDLPDKEEEKEEKEEMVDKKGQSVGTKEQEHQPHSNKAKRKWACLGLRSGKDAS